MKISSAHLEEFKRILGKGAVLTDAKEVLEYAKDWTKPLLTDASCVLFPKSTEEVSKVMSYCSSHRLAIVPSGGRTGLAGGATAQGHEIILSLSRMNRILNIDPIGMTVEVEAGVTTQALQEAVDKHQLFYGVDLGSRGSCQIGGNIATNAGGLKFVRYTGTREQVLGLETVLADGRILDSNRSLRKNNSGYNFNHLFIGSEGTLGVITKATLKLERKPKALKVACLCNSSFSKIMEVFKLAHRENLSLTAFEFFSDKALDCVLKVFPQLKFPFKKRSALYALIEIEEGLGSLSLEDFLEKNFELEQVEDAVLASTTEEFRNLWSFRENITESVARLGHVRKNDVAVGVGSLAQFYEEILLLNSRGSEGIEVVMFGHAGDGNIHLNYLGSPELDIENFVKKAKQIEQKVFAIVKKFRGTVSAEHGIGTLKKNDLHLCCSELEIAFMKDIKRIFDPQGILNPGKIFDM